MKKVLVDRMRDEQSSQRHWSTRACDAGAEYATNPFFAPLAHFERMLLQKSRLTSGEASCVADALDPKWLAFVSWTVGTWRWQLEALPAWEAAAAAPACVADRARDLVSDALVLLLRHRPHRRRPGLELVEAVRGALDGFDLSALLPAAGRYVARCQLSIGGVPPAEELGYDSEEVKGVSDGRTPGKGKGRCSKGWGKGGRIFRSDA